MANIWEGRSAVEAMLQIGRAGSDRGGIIGVASTPFSELAAFAGRVAITRGANGLPRGGAHGPVTRSAPILGGRANAFGSSRALPVVRIGARDGRLRTISQALRAGPAGDRFTGCGACARGRGSALGRRSSGADRDTTDRGDSDVSACRMLLIGMFAAEVAWLMR
jgi:hypothetical protein